MSNRAEPNPITLRIKVRAPGPTAVATAAGVVVGKVPARDYREEFWTRVKDASPDMQAWGWARFEAKLVREFGPALRQKLIAHLRAPLEETGWIPDADLLERIQQDADIDAFYRAKLYQDFTEFLEVRKKHFADKVFLTAFDKLAAAASLIFVVRIDGYHSLSLSLLVGALDKLALVFDGDAFNLKLFLGAFAAEAFGDVFGSRAADEFDFDTIVPNSLAEIIAERKAQVPSDQIGTEQHEQTGVREVAQHQAKVAWRYATTTMLIPVLLALTVTYFTFEEMRTISARREKAVESMLEHQLQLLREDRLRMTPSAESGSNQHPTARDTAVRR